MLRTCPVYGQHFQIFTKWSTETLRRESSVWTVSGFLYNYCQLLPVPSQWGGSSGLFAGGENHNFQVVNSPPAWGIGGRSELSHRGVLSLNQEKGQPKDQGAKTQKQWFEIPYLYFVFPLNKQTKGAKIHTRARDFNIVYG